MSRCPWPCCSQWAYPGRMFCYYHRAVTDGLLEPAERYLGTSEITALLNGRRHGDGRRLDRYVTEPRPGPETDTYFEWLLGQEVTDSQ